VPYGQKTARKGKWLKGPGFDFFNAIKRHLGELPIIAEDLGEFAPAVQELLDGLGFPGMKVLQFAFDATKKNPHMAHNFVTDNMAVYTGTHDNDTTMGWYNAASDKERDQFRRYFNVSGDNAAWDLIRAAFLSVANVAVVPMQDVLSLDTTHRMNTPGTMEGNWRFRLKEGQLCPNDAEHLAYLSKLSDRNLVPCCDLDCIGLECAAPLTEDEVSEPSAWYLDSSAGDLDCEER
jgi:4-alpha-glucanotransferase